MTPTAETSNTEKVRAHEQRMLALASFFDLNDLGDRARPATVLANLFFDLMRSVLSPLSLRPVPATHRCHFELVKYFQAPV